MCGIVAMAGAGLGADARAVLPRMNETLRHRGPDDAGVWWAAAQPVGLAQRRLAVIDLSPAGHQPMTDATGCLAIVFNGELYNFRELRAELESAGVRFRSRTDTEVVLEAYRAWGTDCLTRFNGMFAFALHDAAKGIVFAARDRAGEKPLFYHHAGGRLLLASELKALFEDPSFPRRLDADALEAYLAYGFVPGERCILDGVRKLAAGHALLYHVQRDTLRTCCYWDLPEPGPGAHRGEGDALDEFAFLLEDAVRLRMLADVPVGILLSGGLDSSLVTAMAARLSPEPVRTFTVAFPGHGRFDESAHARLVARHFGTDHTELVAEPASVSLLPRLARQYDEPLADSSMVPTYLVSRLIRAEATVALGGDGGDELFGGYTHYNWIVRQERVRALVPAAARGAVGAVGRALPVGTRGRNHLIGFARDRGSSISHINLYFDAATRDRLLAPLRRGGRRAAPPERHKEAIRPGASPLQQVTAVDFKTYLPDDILVKVDRASMLASLEMRAPFLDHRLIEFAFRLPDALRATARDRKVLPRALARRILPPELDLRRKQGFSLPLATWFRGEWGRFVEDVLREAEPALFDSRVVAGLLAGQRRGLANTARLFALTIFELWRREYRIGLPA